MSKALRLLARRPYAKAELRKRLQQAGYDEEAISAVVKHLSECQYLDDRAFAEYWVTNRLRLKSMGKRRLRQELRDKGVADEIVEAVLNNCAPLHDERDLALALARQRAQGKSPTKRELRRLSGFLYRRGFSGADVDAVLRKLYAEPDGSGKAFLDISDK
ncbi:MAG TPA: regulatory protein RecX [Firmicutes bacterium]|nr:regulatory protein RecX [Bacillota bacterium]